MKSKSSYFKMAGKKKKDNLKYEMLEMEIKELKG